MNNEYPINRDMRLWMESAYLWLVQEFGDLTLKNKKILLPDKQYFPVVYDGSMESLLQTASIVSQQMDIDLNEINIETYIEQTHEIPGDNGFSIFTEVDPDPDNTGLTTGRYFGKNENGKFDVFVEERNLQNPQMMVATLAHEFAHIKLLGEERIEENDEHLTDLTTVIFGFGVFNANEAFSFSKSFYSWSSFESGYLKQREWGYALALHTYYLKMENFEWISYLGKNLQSDYKKSLEFMNQNRDKIFMEPYQPR